MGWVLLFGFGIALVVIHIISDKRMQALKRMTFGKWAVSDHGKLGQARRMERAAYAIREIWTPPWLIDGESKTYAIRGSRDAPYAVTLDSCTCPDFEERRLPCKHIYQLAVFSKQVPLAFLEQSRPTQNSQANFPAGSYRILCLHDKRKFAENYMSVPYFSVKATGINPKTGRKNTKQYQVRNVAEVSGLLKADGLDEPYEILSRESGYSKPSDNQLKYARDLGIRVIPSGCSAPDVSAMIDRALTDDHTPPPKGLAEYFQEEGYMFSRFSNYSTLKDRFLTQATLRDKTLVFMHLVHMKEIGGTASNLKKNKYYDLYNGFYESERENLKFVTSLETLFRDDFKLHRGSIAYKHALRFLTDNGVIAQKPQNPYERVI